MHRSLSRPFRVTDTPGLSSTPLNKMAVPSDVAKQIVVLSSAVVSGHVTGQVVMIAGGRMT